MTMLPSVRKRPHLISLVGGGFPMGVPMAPAVFYGPTSARSSFALGLLVLGFALCCVAGHSVALRCGAAHAGVFCGPT
eukprot:3445303-Rhodomonas_salina.1